MIIIPVLDIHIPAHKLHLEAKDCGIAAVVGEDKFESITVGDPSESLAKTHVAAFIDGVVPGECFTKVGMQPALVPFSATTSECNRVEDSFQQFFHKLNLPACHATGHRRARFNVISRLKSHVSKTIGREVGPEDEQEVMVVPLEARIG